MAASPPPRPQFDDDDDDDQQQGVSAGAASNALGGHWRRWRRALLGRSSSAPLAQDPASSSSSSSNLHNQQQQLSLADLMAKFPHLHDDILQVVIISFFYYPQNVVVLCLRHKRCEMGRDRTRVNGFPRPTTKYRASMKKKRIKYAHGRESRLLLPSCCLCLGSLVHNGTTREQQHNF